MKKKLLNYREKMYLNLIKIEFFFQKKHFPQTYLSLSLVLLFLLFLSSSSVGKHSLVHPAFASRWFRFRAIAGRLKV